MANHEKVGMQTLAVLADTDVPVVLQAYKDEGEIKDEELVSPSLCMTT